MIVRSDAWAIASIAVDTTGGSPAPMRIVLARGSRVLLDLNGVAATSVITVTDAQGGLVARPSAASVDRGRGEIAPLVLAPGRYTVTVRDVGMPTRTWPLLVTSLASQVLVLD